MSEISATALSGLHKAAQSIAENADKISSGADIGNPEPFVEIKQAEVSFKANAKVLEVDKKLGDYILDLFA